MQVNHYSGTHKCIPEQRNHVYNERGFPFWNGNAMMSHSTITSLLP
jgi:hypothetical protein